MRAPRAKPHSRFQAAPSVERQSSAVRRVQPNSLVPFGVENKQSSAVWRRQSSRITNKPPVYRDLRSTVGASRAGG